MSTGTVKWYNPAKGYGFITPDDGGEDLLVHERQIVSDYQSRKLHDRQRVSFDIATGQQGPEALAIRAIETECHPSFASAGI